MISPCWSASRAAQAQSNSRKPSLVPPDVGQGTRLIFVRETPASSIATVTKNRSMAGGLPPFPMKPHSPVRGRSGALGSAMPAPASDVAATDNHNRDQLRNPDVLPSGLPPSPSIMLWIRFLLGLYILPCLSAAPRGRFYPYDFTDATGQQLAFNTDGSELRAARGKVLSEYLCGAYGGNFDITSGDTLHVFPDGNVMLVDWCDIFPKRLIGEGRWSLRDKGISIVWEWRRFANNRAEELFRQLYGDGKDFDLYLVFLHGLVKKVILVPNDPTVATGLKIFPNELPVTTGIKIYLMRECEYKDWQRVRAELSAAKRGVEDAK